MRYAVPTPYFAVGNEDLNGLRQRLAAAETTAARALDWTTRTRATEDAKQLRQRIEAAQVHQRAARTTPAATNQRATTPAVATNAFARLPFAEQDAILRAAAAELRRVGVA